MSTWIIDYEDELYHHGIKGQKWGVRRWQNEDGSLTPEGVRRYGTVENFNKAQKRKKLATAIGAGALGTAAAVGGALAIGNAARNAGIDRQRNDAKIERDRQWAKEAFWASEINEHNEKVEQGRKFMKELFWASDERATAAGIPLNAGPANFMGGPRKLNGGRNVRVIPR